jgi:hypothetical protein
MRHPLLLAPLLLIGCADSAGVGPSLARRPIESRDLSEPARQAEAPAAADAELLGQIEGLLNRARTGEREFAALLPRTEAAAAAAGVQGSESWIAAQQLLSALEAARGATTASLGRLDALLAERVLARNDAGLAELQAAQQEVAALAERQQAQLDRLQTRINR